MSKLEDDYQKTNSESRVEVTEIVDKATGKYCYSVRIYNKEGTVLTKIDDLKTSTEAMDAVTKLCDTLMEILGSEWMSTRGWISIDEHVRSMKLQVAKIAEALMASVEESNIQDSVFNKTKGEHEDS